MHKRTIILLSAKRTGSTAVFRAFQKHPEVGIPHIDPEVNNWEPNFWNKAAQAIDGNADDFNWRMERMLPDYSPKHSYSKADVFSLWDSIIQHYGPIVFDKSPQYLGNNKAMDLLKEYMNRGNDVRFVGLIRHPLDAISSQHTLWGKHNENVGPGEREQQWLKKYSHLEHIQQKWFFFPIFRYEDIAEAPRVYFPLIYHYCGIRDAKETTAHIRPVNTGRHRIKVDKQLRKWHPGQKMQAHLKDYGYGNNQHQKKSISLKQKLVLLYNQLRN